MIRWLRARRDAAERDARIRREAKADYREAVIDVRDHRITELEQENAALKAALATVHIQGWMHGQIVQRDRAAHVERAEADRMARLADHPTSMYATEQIRRQE